MKEIELLAPAKNLESGIAAINFGADAVYIGAPKFSARLAAGNSISDIKKLADYAHRYYAKVYVTLNTILHNHELQEAQQTIHQIYESGVDALIIQDMGILEMDIPPLPIFASTQTHNYNWQKVKFLEDIGIQRVILARELSFNQIAEIREKTNIDLEFFIHGALCVSYSGQCYFSHAIGKGSANRGACAQPCRAYYSLVDHTGKTLVKNKHLLSLKDLNLSDKILNLLDSGISSFKIEGRLKDLDYVKNITSNYRQQIDHALSLREGLKKTSTGKIYYDFIPDPEKTFNRGYTDYFVKHRNKEIASLDTQKSIGKLIGVIQTIKDNYVEMETKEKISNGDGICFFNKDGNLQGTKINQVEKNKIYPDNIENMHVGMQVFRNHDHEFSKSLNSSKTERKIDAFIMIEEISKGVKITAVDEDKNTISWDYEIKKEQAKNAELANKNIQNQFSKAGDSVFTIEKIKINLKTPLFFPISELNQLRRKTIDLLELDRLKNYSRKECKILESSIPYYENIIDYKGNVLNDYAVRFYKKHGVQMIENAFETISDFSDKEIMITKHCIKYQMGACEKYENNPIKLSEPLFLVDNNNTYTLDFDCENCVMKVIYSK